MAGAQQTSDSSSMGSNPLASSVHFGAIDGVVPCSSQSAVSGPEGSAARIWARMLCLAPFARYAISSDSLT